jgi:Domain of unknown function (DUF4337)
MSLPDVLDPTSDVMPGRLTAIYIAALAVLIAITSVGGDNATKDMIRSSIDAADTYSFYQAKTIRQTTVRALADDFEARLADPAVSAPVRQKLQEKLASYRATADRYESEPATGEGRKELLAKARGLETQRDLALKRDPYFDLGGALLQIAVVLASASLILAGPMLLWISGALGVLGAALMLNGFLLLVDIPFLG